MQFWNIFLRVSWVCFFCLSAGKGEVLPQHFGNCRKYFFGEMEPQGIIPANAARICQKYNNKYHYATMYDRNLRIPLYSAYIFQPGHEKRHDEWQIEPQLVDKNLNSSMEDEILTTIDRKRLKDSQAVSGDYKSKDASTYEKGHLNPVSHQPSHDSKLATFSLTNIVPQLSTLNQGQWKQYEEKLQNYITHNHCNEAYVITGVIPGTRKINNRVTIPSDIWSAVCCIQKNACQRTRAVIASNNANVIAEISISNLQKKITTYTGRGVNLFPARLHVNTSYFKSDNYYEMILNTFSETFHFLKEESFRIFSSIFTTA